MSHFETKLIRPPPKDFIHKCNAKQHVFAAESKGNTRTNSSGLWPLSSSGQKILVLCSSIRERADIKLDQDFYVANRKWRLSSTLALMPSSLIQEAYWEQGHCTGNLCGTNISPCARSLSWMRKPWLSNAWRSAQPSLLPYHYLTDWGNSFSMIMSLIREFPGLQWLNILDLHNLA